MQLCRLNTSVDQASDGATRSGEPKDALAVSVSKPGKEKGLDGGLKAWTVVFGAWCCLFCGFGWVNGESFGPFIRVDLQILTLHLAIGIFQDYYEKHQLQDHSSSSISWILSLEPFVLFAAGLIIGKVSVNCFATRKC